MAVYTLLRWMTGAATVLFSLCCAYQLFYFLVPALIRHKPHRPTQLHRFAILIAARNEEAVLPHLLDSLRAQDYPAELFDIYVVADNCTDHTADVARAGGAAVHIRFNDRLIGKGYALHELIEVIHAARGQDFYDGYFVFDADNLLAPDYIRRMNETFSDGYGVVTSYRNSKNYGANWISAGYGLWFMRESRFLNDARMRLGLSCAVTGTGFCFSRAVLARSGGWNFFLLSEDTEFSVSQLLAGERIGFCPDAVFYDEQPVSFAQSWRQRMRWAKGYLQVWRHYGGRLLRSIAGVGGFSAYDMTMTILPALLLNLITVAAHLAAIVAAIALDENVLLPATSLLRALWGGYLSFFVMGLVTTLSEWRHLHTTTAKKVGYLFTFPLFMLTYIPISIAAMFCRVEWKPIEHKAAMSIEHVGRE